MSEIRDITLAPSGHRKIDWVRSYMPALTEIEKRFEKEKPFAGLRVAVSVHLEAKTAYLARTLALGVLGVLLAALLVDPLSIPLAPLLRGLARERSVEWVGVQLPAPRVFLVARHRALAVQRSHALPPVYVTQAVSVAAASQ